MLGVFGVGFAIFLLIILIYKRVSLIPATLICTIVLSLTSGIPYMELMSSHYAVALAEFVRKYFLLFVSNALFGKIMELALLTAALAKLVDKLFGDKNAVFGAMLVTAFLSYGGVSVFVIVFTVYPLYLTTFRKADLPRKYIPACIMSSSCTFPLSMLPGNAQLNNVVPTRYIDTTLMAAPVVSVICGLFAMTFLFLYFRHEFNKCRANNEHFEPDAEILARIEKFDRESGIPAWQAALPMILIIVLINVWAVDLSIAVFAATALAVVIGRKNIPNLLGIVNEGIKTVGPSMVTTATSVGFGGAVLACAGAQTILLAISSLSINPTISFAIAAAFAGTMTGSGGGSIDVAMNLLSQPYLQIGLQPEIMHRVAAIATAGFSCLPHNGMQLNIMDICGLSAKNCYKYIFISTVLNSFLCLLIAVVWGCLFYPVGLS